MKIYFAGPLFTEAERRWIRGVKREIEELAARRGRSVEVLWPYELLDREEAEALGEGAKREIFLRCKTHLEDSDLLLALLDGPQVDDGVAWEMGYFFRLREGASRPIIGIRTDFRRAGEAKNSIVNAMIECSCDRIAASTEELLAILPDFLEAGELGRR